MINDGVISNLNKNIYSQMTVVIITIIIQNSYNDNGYDNNNIIVMMT